MLSVAAGLVLLGLDVAELTTVTMRTQTAWCVAGQPERAPTTRSCAAGERPRLSVCTTACVIASRPDTYPSDRARHTSIGLPTFLTLPP